MKLVAHRGLPQYYPENTIIGFQKAIQADTDAIECDIQFSADGEPFLLHDLSLKRTAELDVNISDLTASELVDVSVHEPGRFGETFNPTRIKPLSSLVPLLLEYPEVLLFLEIKNESLDYISRSACVDKIHELVAPVFKQIIIISFDSEVLRLAKERYGYKIGRVLNTFSETEGQDILNLGAEFLICDKKKLPENTQFKTTSRWMVYDLVDETQAKSLCDRGVEWIESWDVSALT